MILIAPGVLVDESQITAIWRYPHKGRGSTSVRNLVLEALARARPKDAQGNFLAPLGPPVWDVSSDDKKRSVVLLRNGEMYLTSLSFKPLYRRYLAAKSS